MRYLTIPVLVLTLTLLSACHGSGRHGPVPSDRQLPPMPSNLRACLVQAGVPVPNRSLTVGEMTKLWAQDRYRLAAKRRCGQQVVNWYSRLRRGWR